MHLSGKSDEVSLYDSSLSNAALLRFPLQRDPVKLTQYSFSQMQL